MSSELICPWAELAPDVRRRLAPVLAASSEGAAARWAGEFQSNSGGAAGLVLVYAAMEAAGIWDCVGELLSSWGVGIFFAPAPGLVERLDANPKFLRLSRRTLHQHWAHHWYWQHCWIQRDVRHAAIHLGVNRQLENGWRKAEVHLDIYNSFYSGFHPLLAVRHLRAEVIGRRRFAPDYFQHLLEGEGIAVPRFMPRELP